MALQLEKGILDPRPPMVVPGGQRVQIAVYEFIPTLGPGPPERNLLPQSGGRPGFTYAQVPTSERARAREEGWEGLDPPLFFAIRGPKGQIELELVARGAPIPGEPSQSGARLCTVHGDVQTVTGIQIPVYGGPDNDRPLEEAPHAEVAQPV